MGVSQDMASRSWLTPAFKVILLLRLSLYTAAISANIAAVVVNFGSDVFTHIDVWAPAVNTALLIYLYHQGRKGQKKTDEAKQVAREGVEELRNIATEVASGGDSPPES